MSKRALTEPQALAVASWKRLEATLFRIPHEKVKLNAYGALASYLQRDNNYTAVRQFLGSFRALLAATLPGVEFPPLEEGDNVVKLLNAYCLVHEQEIDLALNSDYATMCTHGKQVALQFTALGRSVAKYDTYALQRAVSSFATRWKAYQFHEKRWRELMAPRIWQPLPDGLVLDEREVHAFLLHPEMEFFTPQTSWYALDQDLTHDLHVMETQSCASTYAVLEQLHTGLAKLFPSHAALLDASFDLDYMKARDARGMLTADTIYAALGAVLHLLEPGGLQDPRFARFATMDDDLLPEALVQASKSLWAAQSAA